MGKPQDIRRIVNLHNSGSSWGTSARYLKVPRPSLQTTVSQCKHHGNVLPSYGSGRRRLVETGGRFHTWERHSCEEPGWRHRVVGMWSTSQNKWLLRKEHYVEILKQHLQTSARKWNLGVKGSSTWIRRVPPKLVTEELKDNKVKVLSTKHWRQSHSKFVSRAGKCVCEEDGLQTWLS